MVVVHGQPGQPRPLGKDVLLFRKAAQESPQLFPLGGDVRAGIGALPRAASAALGEIRVVRELGGQDVGLFVDPSRQIVQRAPLGQFVSVVLVVVTVVRGRLSFLFPGPDPHDVVLDEGEGDAAQSARVGDELGGGCGRRGRMARGRCGAV
ncbi:hypothetical protein [Streptomyces sp. SGAir0957]